MVAADFLFSGDCGAAAARPNFAPEGNVERRAVLAAIRLRLLACPGIPRQALARQVRRRPAAACRHGPNIFPCLRTMAIMAKAGRAWCEQAHAGSKNLPRVSTASRAPNSASWGRQAYATTTKRSIRWRRAQRHCSSLIQRPAPVKCSGRKPWRRGDFASARISLQRTESRD
jgi:hypothetical protein